MEASKLLATCQQLANCRCTINYKGSSLRVCGGICVSHMEAHWGKSKKLERGALGMEDVRMVSSERKCLLGP